MYRLTSTWLYLSSKTSVDFFPFFSLSHFNIKLPKLSRMEQSRKSNMQGRRAAYVVSTTYHFEDICSDWMLSCCETKACCTTTNKLFIFKSAPFNLKAGKNLHMLFHGDDNSSTLTQLFMSASNMANQQDVIYNKDYITIQSRQRKHIIASTLYPPLRISL